MEEKAISILKICAWLNLVVGLLAAISIWLAGRANTPGIMTGIIYAAAGIIGWAFLQVVCSIAESLIEIRTNTAEPAKSRLFDREKR
jgi:nicotinamide riboside transporter PnuC